MNAYILGAGVSKSVGYPVGTELFDEIDKYVRGSGNLTDRFDYRKGWNDIHDWLETNSNPMIAQAYRTKNIEHLFTVLDFAIELRQDALIKDYQQHRSTLLWALEHYFAWRHYEDYGWAEQTEWDTLKAFADKLNPGDVVITFNYDATLERVLLDQQKWSLGDGYGFELVFQQSRFDQTQVAFGNSPILTLHMHGATGWCRPIFAPGFDLAPEGGGALPREAFGAAPMGTKISLDPQFLEALGIYHVDACLPDMLSVAQERHVVLHPSFLKDYETDESDSHVFIKLWQKAAQAL